MQITESLFVAYCQCPYKAFLKSKGEVGEVVDLEAIQTGGREIQGGGDRAAVAEPR